MTRGRVALVLLIPVLLLVTGDILVRIPVDPEARIERQAAEVAATFDALLRTAFAAATCAIDEAPDAAPACTTRAFRDRLEGAAVVARDGFVETWYGTPADLGEARADDHPHWSTRSVGLRTSLVARTPARPDGRFGVATFVLDAPVSGQPFEALFAGAVRRNTDVHARFGAAAGGGEASRPSSRAVSLVDPSGTPVGQAILDPIAPGARSAATRALWRALAAAVFALLLATCIRWKEIVITPWGPWIVAGALAMIHEIFLLARVPETLLPRELGSPSLFGVPGVWGLARSPAALLETVLASLLLALAARRFVRRATTRRAAVVATIVTGCSAATLVLLGLLSEALATDTRVPVLTLSATSAGQATLLLALALALIATAGWLSCAWSAWCHALRSRARASGRAPETVALAAVSLFSVIVLQHTTERQTVERLRSEFAPQIVEQSALRRLALQASVREAASNRELHESLTAFPPGTTNAYALWLSSALFRQGYLSSLDVLGPGFEPRGHFAFGLPPLDEDHDATPIAEGEIELRDEESPVGATRLHLVHARAAVRERGTIVGWVVGHVLDQPDNIPFLPSVAPYLAAIGPGTPRTGSGAAPDYVLYDGDGRVLLATVPEPPAAGAALRDAARRGVAIVAMAGEERYNAVPIPDGDRLHLLLTPARSVLDLLVAFVRVVVVTLILGAVAFVASQTRRSEGPLGLLASLRRSFRRKLLASILMASIVPLLAFALILRTYVERRIEARLVESAAGLAGAVKRVVEDYTAVLQDDPDLPPPPITDDVLSWLRGIVEQEIHLYESGVLAATSKPELFASGLLLRRLPGDVQRAVVEEGLPYVVREERLGEAPLPVAYARVDLPGAAPRAVVAVPLVLQQREIARTVDRLIEMLMLVTASTAALLSAAAAWVARSVARPVGQLAAATRRIATGDYSARVTASTKDEIASLVESFNAMASALASQRADLERRRDYMEALLRNATTGVLSTDAQGVIVTMNPVAERLVGSVGGVLRPGLSLREAVSAIPVLAPVAEAIARPSRDGADTEEIDLALPGGGRRLRLVRATLPDPLGGPSGTLYLVDDVTDLMRSNQLAAWAEMARAIAHEIKNPLTPIQLSTEHLDRLLGELPSAKSPEIAACLDTILKQVRALRDIAAEFSAYAKLPDLELRPIDPGEFLRDTIAAYRAALPRGVVLDERHDPAPSIAIDRRVLGRAIINLVENALQAMPEGGTLSIRSGPVSAGGVEFIVRDTGTGIAPEARERLFTPYFSTKSSGTGLGLAIVRRAVEAHRGRIEVDSVPGIGTAFRVVLPRIARDLTEAPPPELGHRTL